MRATQILLPITFLCLWSTVQAEEPPRPRIPVEILERLDDHENRLIALERKASIPAAKTCPCPDGPCICKDGECDCPDCPEHVGTRLDSRVRILHWSADWCGPCIGFEREAKPAGVWDRMLHYDFDSNAEAKEILGVTQIPTVLLVKDERVIDRHVGQAGMLSKVQEWLKNPVAKSPQVSRVVRYEDPVRYSRPRYIQPAYYQPRIYYRPYSGPSYGGFYGGYSGGCATCR